MIDSILKQKHMNKGAFLKQNFHRKQNLKTELVFKKSKQFYNNFSWLSRFCDEKSTIFVNNSNSKQKKTLKFPTNLIYMRNMKNDRLIPIQKYNFTVNSI